MRAWIQGFALSGCLAGAAPTLAGAQAPPSVHAVFRAPAHHAAAPFGWLADPPARPGGVRVYRPTPPARAETTAAAGAGTGIADRAVPDFRMPDGRAPESGTRDGGVPDGGISCVPFARMVSGIDVVGDAATWWDGAAGRYGRGARPEPGGVLSFRAIDQMPLGHVAVVARILDSRRITVDHANWDNAGGVARDVPVLDVSPDNDWTQVRVAVADDGDFGAVYPTNGFIYKHPDGGAMAAAAAGDADADGAAATRAPRPPRNPVSARPVVAPAGAAPPGVAPPGAALPVVQSGPTGRGQIYLATSIFGVAGPRPGATPGSWSIAAARPRVVIASGGTRSR